MTMARQELGPDAMLVSSRRSSDEATHPGAYEVVFAVMPDQARDTVPPVTGYAIPPAVRGPAVDRLFDEVAEMKHQMERLSSALARSSSAISRLAGDPEIADVFARWIDAEVDPELAYDAASRVASQPHDGRAAALLESELAKFVTADARLGRDGDRSIVALVGPPGAGKTSTLVKLAVRYGLAARRRTQILTLDTQRIAASEQLRSYAAIAGMAFEEIATPTALFQALEEHSGKEMILIDTPGLGRNDLDDGRDLASAMSRHPSIDTHLVLNACTKPADLRRLAADFRMFAPAKLVFTHVDETNSFGSLLSLSARTGMPVSFLSTGQRVPEDLEPAERRALAALVTGNQCCLRNALGATAAA